MDYTERVLRQRIAAIPDGEYRAEGFLDDDGKNRDVRLPIKVCVRVQGDGIEIDLTGSSNQVETAFNVPFEGSTKVACFCAIRSLLLDAVTSDVKVPSNQGSFRPVKVTAPKGSIYNPIFPGRRRGALCPDQPGDRSDLQGAGAGVCRTTSSPAARRACRSAPMPASARAATIGFSSRSTRALTAAARAAMAPTASTA